MHQSAILAELRATIARVERTGSRADALAFGVPAIDRHLPAGGLSAGALHEIVGSPALGDDAAATVFLAGVLARAEGTILWCLRWRDLFAPALQLAGLHPDRVIFVEAGSDSNVLVAMEECLRHGGLGAVVGETGKLSLTASRRLQLAAEQSGVPAFVFRRAVSLDAKGGGTAALTRWRVRTAPSEELGFPGLGRPRWSVSLERVRGGEPHHWIVEACDAQGRIALPAALVDRSAATAERQAAA